MSGLLQLPTTAVIRGPVADDQRFIAATFYRSVLGNNRAPRRRRHLNDQIDRILDDKSTRCLIAASASNADKILGWILYSSAPIARICHYLYVRDEERGKGIARRLIDQAWPTSQARFIATMRGPHTQRFLDRVDSSVFVPLEEFLR